MLIVAASAPGTGAMSERARPEASVRAQGLQGPPPGPARSVAFVDVVALDADGRPDVSLAASDFRVAVDGKPRAVLSARYVFSGPGATAAARVAAASRGGIDGALAEPARIILLAVDENSIVRGEEKAAQAAVRRVFDVVGAADNAALVTLPVTRGETTMSTDRQPVRERLAALVGRGASSDLLARADPFDQREPDLQLRDDEPDTERQRTGGDVQPGTARDDLGARGLDSTGASGDPVERLTSPQALARMLGRLRGVPGRKTVILFVGGARAAPPDPRRPRDVRDELAAVLEAAVASRSVIHVVGISRTGIDRTHEVMATGTGGLFLRANANARDFDRLTEALSGAYLLRIESLPGDRDGRSHALTVGPTAKTTAIRAPQRWTWRDDPEPLSVADDQHAGVADSPTAGPVAGTASLPVPPPTDRASRPPAAGTRVVLKRPSRPDPELDVVLGRMTDYLDGYLNDFANVVAEERYEQRVYVGATAGASSTRRLRSDLLLVRVPGPFGWVPFRDVFEVDGRPLREREERLRKLFLENPDTALGEARRIADEGARYNIGTVFRNLNMPTLPLMFLVPGKLPGFTFARHGEDTVEGIRAWRIDYEEVERPTIIRRPGADVEVPASGSFWVDPSTGRILRTKVRASVGALTMETTVTYRRSDTLGIWAPAEMEESYNQPSETIEGKAVYLNFRRFQVSTDVNIAAPKKQAAPPR